MSGHGYHTYCPVCNDENVNAYSDHKPHPYVSGECLTCGFNYHTIRGERLTLDEINEMREDQEQPKLTKKEYDEHSSDEYFTINQ